MPPAAGGGAAEGARQVSRRRAGEVKALVQDVLIQVRCRREATCLHLASSAFAHRSYQAMFRSMR